MSKNAGNVFGREEQCKIFWERQPYFLSENGLFWMWCNKENCWKISNEYHILNKISEDIGFERVIKNGERTELINSLKQYGSLKKPKDFPENHIQFLDCVVDLNLMKEPYLRDENGKKVPYIKPDPMYFSTNPIPWEVGDTEDTPTIDKLFREWVGEKNVKKLYQIIAYCMIPSYPIERIFCLIGSGANGKSCFLQLLRKFIGMNNITSTDLGTLLKSRFEVTRLHKKLVCMMGETNFNEMNNTQLIKKLVSGKDLIGFEYKNKNPFEDVNYAKLIIATNSLPPTTDKTIGFYRRWIIIDFPNQFNGKKDVLSEIPKREYKNLARKSIIILKELLKNREFDNEGDYEFKRIQYEEKSNPLDKFFEEEIIEDFEDQIPKFKLREELDFWFVKRGYRKISDKEIAKYMKEKGIEDKKIQFNINNEDKRWRCWVGIKLRNGSVQDVQDVHGNSTYSHAYRAKWEVGGQAGQAGLTKNNSKKVSIPNEVISIFQNAKEVNKPITKEMLQKEYGDFSKFIIKQLLIEGVITEQRKDQFFLV